MYMFVEAVKKTIVKLRQYAGRVPEDRLLLLLAIVVGLGCGLAAVLLKQLIHLFQWIMNEFNIKRDLCVLFSTEGFEEGVETAVVEIGNKSFKLLQRGVNTETGEVKCSCETIMVGYNLKTLQAEPIPQEWKDAFCTYEGRDLLRK